MSCTPSPAAYVGLRLCIGAVMVVGCVGCSKRSRGMRGAASSPALAAHEVPQLRDDFEGRSLASFWMAGDHGSGRFALGAVELTGDYARSGRQSAKITVREGDIAQVGDSNQPNERAELDSGKQAFLGRDVWYGFSFLVPNGFPVVQTRLVIAQWKQSGLEGSPVIAQRFVGGRHYVTVRDLSTRGNWRATYELPDIRPGRWNDMVYHIRFSNGSDGLVEFWMNGVHAARCEGPTASPEGDEHFYHKVGLYRDRMTEPMTIYLDNYAVGDRFDAVAPARFAHGE